MSTKRTMRNVQSTHERLARIESSLRDIEAYMNQAKKQMEYLDQVRMDLDEIKKNTKKKKISLFTKKKKQPQEQKINQITDLLENPLVKSMLGKNMLTDGKGMDLGQITGLLQNPLIQSMLIPKGGKGGQKAKKAIGSSSPGFSELMGIFNSPAIQSLLKK
ncbi:hypothetical protein [Ammoniphilus resinae]|uniref:Uncharacterized protein n=1 Tax=Ammoniphilus resinae TaxID=861532 RepID=A0ABS4GMZ1_9BACL|nr:hypothetical protein [Ammoniphilus resinae]MBP1931646.1 hypothetical protein [Ammoniphilus resinae]